MTPKRWADNDMLLIHNFFSKWFLNNLTTESYFRHLCFWQFTFSLYLYTLDLCKNCEEGLFQRIVKPIKTISLISFFLSFILWKASTNIITQNRAIWNVTWRNEYNCTRCHYISRTEFQYPRSGWTAGL